MSSLAPSQPPLVNLRHNPDIRDMSTRVRELRARALPRNAASGFRRSTVHKRRRFAKIVPYPHIRLPPGTEFVAHHNGFRGDDQIAGNLAATRISQVVV